MSLLYISASPVTFKEGVMSMLISYEAPPYRERVEIKRLADVEAAIDKCRAHLATVDMKQFAKDESTGSNLDYTPNGFSIFVKILQGRAPSGFHQIPRARLTVDRRAA